MLFIVWNEIKYPHFHCFVCLVQWFTCCRDPQFCLTFRLVIKSSFLFHRWFTVWFVLNNPDIGQHYQIYQSVYLKCVILDTPGMTITSMISTPGLCRSLNWRPYVQQQRRQVVWSFDIQKKSKISLLCLEMVVILWNISEESLCRSYWSVFPLNCLVVLRWYSLSMDKKRLIVTTGVLRMRMFMQIWT